MMRVWATEYFEPCPGHYVTAEDAHAVFERWRRMQEYPLTATTTYEFYDAMEYLFGRDFTWSDVGRKKVRVIMNVRFRKGAFPKAMAKWLAECCRAEEGARTPLGEMFTNWESWVKRNKVKYITYPYVFLGDMESLGQDVDRAVIDGTGREQWIVNGIKLVDEFDNLEEK